MSAILVAIYSAAHSCGADERCFDFRFERSLRICCPSRLALREREILCEAEHQVRVWRFLTAWSVTLPGRGPNFGEACYSDGVV